MTVASASDRSERLRRVQRALVVGVLLLVPRIVLAWLVLPSAYDLTQIVVTLVFVAGLFVLGTALIRLRLLRQRRLLPVGLGGLAAVLTAGLALGAFPLSRDAVAFSGGLIAPAQVALTQWFYLAIGALSQLGLVLLIGSIGAAISRRLAAR